MGTGLIYAAIVAAWAAYLVPLWLRRHDEMVPASTPAMGLAAESTEPDQRSERIELDESPEADAPVDPREVRPVATSTRVLTRRAPVPPAGRRYPVDGVPAAEVAVDSDPAPPSRRVHDERPAGRSAAVASAAGSTEGDGELDGPTPSPRDDPAVADEAAVSAAAHARGWADTVEVAGSLWDPIPVPLPTYVTKAKAPRTVRTIDLTAPGVWSSGALPESEMLPRSSDAVADMVGTGTPAWDPNWDAEAGQATARIRADGGASQVYDDRAHGYDADGVDHPRAVGD